MNNSGTFSHLDNQPKDNSFFADWLQSEDSYIEDSDGTYKIHSKLEVKLGGDHPFVSDINPTKKSVINVDITNFLFNK